MSQPDDTLSPATRLLRAGRPHRGWVNTPVTRASTFVFDSVAQWRDTRARRGDERLLSYGARGTDSTHALEDALVELEGGYRAKLYPTGQSAIATLFLAYLRAGDHVLITDAVYEPVRRFCTDQLTRLGIEFTYFLPDGSDLESKIRPNTRLLYTESPGSLAYEMLDLPKWSAWAHERGCIVAVDNTWGAGYLYRPLTLGADVSLQAATKYLGGHADVMMGTIVTTQEAWQPIETTTVNFGITVGADDAYLVLRGIRSLPLRLAAHARHAIEVAQWLQTLPEVARVLCPALPDDPNHALWLRDCNGTNGLISIEFSPGITDEAVERFIDALQLFGLGASWGGFESLVVPINMANARSVSDWSTRGALLRLHIGLEAPADLMADLEQAMTHLTT